MTGPEQYIEMGQAYEVYSEASFWIEMANRGITLERTQGTGDFKQKRPDFVYRHAKGALYFEVKALEIADPLTRHKQLGYEALDSAAELDERARTPGVHFGTPLEIGSEAELELGTTIGCDDRKNREQY